jgi:hypothetical protein
MILRQLDLYFCKSGTLLNKKRLTSLIHKNICKYDTINNTKTLLNELTSLTINVINQIAFTTTQIEFIKLDNTYLLPIYPKAIIVKDINNKFKLLSLDDMNSIYDYITIKNKEFQKKLLQYGYKISKFFYDEVNNIITSIQFENNLIVPIVPENYTYNTKQIIIKKMIENNYLTSKDDIRITTSLFQPS